VIQDIEMGRASVALRCDNAALNSANQVNTGSQSNAMSVPHHGSKLLVKGGEPHDVAFSVLMISSTQNAFARQL
jgi:hypothetical protein